LTASILPRRQGLGVAQLCPAPIFGAGQILFLIEENKP